MWGDQPPAATLERDPEQMAADNSLHKKEQELLLRSSCATAALSLSSILLGLISGAQSIVFDGMFDAIDAAMTLLAWHASRLIARGADCRFQFGYWHLEPILSLVSGSVRLFICTYGLVGGVSSLLNGGRVISYGIATTYAAIACCASLAAFTYIRRARRGVKSSLLESDARGWLFGGLMSGGLCLSFILAQALDGTGAAHLMPYIDPLVLILLTASMLPFPIASVYRAGREILQIAPQELDRQVRTVAQQLMLKYGFVDHQSYVARIGRARFIEIGFITPADRNAIAIAELDTIRREVAAELGGLRHADWLTVFFTAVPRRSLSMPALTNHLHQ